MSAMRLARNLGGKSEPEVVMPTSAHYSFRLGAELLGIRLIETPVDEQMRPGRGRRQARHHAQHRGR